MGLSLRSSVFNEDGVIPLKYTCEGDDVAPPLAWDGVPENAQSLVLIVDDPDAPDPDAPKMIWVHWVVYNIPADVKGLPEGASADILPAGAEEGLNDWNNIGYGGPCPPVGRHRYFFKLFAIDTVLKNLDTPTKAELETAVQGHVIAQAELIGTYKKTNI